MTFEDWDTLATGQLVLPIRGKKYTIPALGYLDEIKLRKSQDAVKRALDNGDPPPKEALTNEQYYAMVLGDALAQMRKDNVPGVAITHAAMVAHCDATEGRAVAERMWKVALDPEALAASMQAAQAKMTAQAKATRQSPSTAAANRTPSRASSKTTRSRKATKQPGSKAKPSTSPRRSPNTT